MCDKATPESKDIYTAYRAQIQYEDGLFNQRITWMIAFEALLWAPFVTLHGEQYDKVSSVPVMKLTIMLMGFGATILALCSCVAANLRITNLIWEYQKVAQERGGFTDLPKIDSSWMLRSFGSVASHGFIFGIAAAWVWQLWDAGQGHPNRTELVLLLAVGGMVLLVLFEVVHAFWKKSQQSRILCGCACQSGGCASRKDSESKNAGSQTGSGEQTSLPTISPSLPS